MGEENKTRDVVDAVAGLAAAVPIYQDALQPAAQELGKALGTVAKTVHLALAPVSALVWGYEKLKDFVETKVAEKLKAVPAENIISPRISVAGPALEALRYAGHEETLGDLYANLLASAMDKSTADGTHPAFVEILKQITPDEARLIQHFLVKGKSFPLIDVGWMERKSVKKAVLKRHFSHFDRVIKAEFPEQVPAYLDNLSRLGLIEIPKGLAYANADIYIELEADPVVLAYQRQYDAHESKKLNIEREMVSVTALGGQFGRVCVAR
ncbi:MAG: DUF4393 domain-containing protein [Pseudomonadota bacterium]